ncbi:MAG TPA: ABC transporter permease [Chloroflexota bacterium]|nr:ABC transporter permease [Chloroflexota bacterium]
MSDILMFTIKRLLAGIVVVWAIVTIVFILEHGPGASDPIRHILGNHYTYGNYRQLLHAYGLDIPLHEQYLNYLGLAPLLAKIGIHFGHGTVDTGLLEGNLGLSYQYPGTPVWDLIRPYVPVSLRLGGYALTVSLLIGIPVGLLSALRQNSLLDHVSQGMMIILYAMPTFVLAPLLQLEFTIQHHWFPEQGWGDSFSEIPLPVAVYAAGLVGYFAKSFRSFMLEVLAQDYIRTARAKGLRQRTILWLHAMKNTLVPLASIVGPVVAYLIVGAFIVERFFAIPGIGDETIQATLNGDYGVIEATTIMLAAFVVLVNLVTDIFYSIIDPRVRL